MADSENTGNPFLDAWLAGQKMFLDAQGPFADQMKKTVDSDTFSDAISRAQENWSLYEKQASDWMAAASGWMNVNAELPGTGGTAEEVLRRMLDPTQFLYAGSDEVNQAIQRLVEGPEFADIGTLERHVLKTTREWFALREAGTAYRGVTAKAWGRAFETFSKEMAADPDAVKQGYRPVLDRWLEIANEELTATQRTDEFLDAQRRLLRAGVDYRIKQRHLVEAWCETHSIPTRTEIDDVHRLVHGLRRQVRQLSKQLAEAKAQPAARSKRTAPRRKPAAKTKS